MIDRSPPRASRLRGVLFALLAVALSCIAWGYGGRTASLLLESVGTIKVSSMPMTEIGFARGKSEWTIFPGHSYLMSSRRYAGHSGDIEEIGFECRISPAGRVVISHDDKSMDLGPLSGPPRQTEFGMTFYAALEPTETASLKEEHGLIVWPAWLAWPEWYRCRDCGAIPLWFRHCYQRLVWQKASGARLELLWRQKQTFERGWFTGGATPEQSGLIHVAITP
jgi:hypothetical protein